MDAYQSIGFRVKVAAGLVLGSVVLSLVGGGALRWAGFAIGMAGFGVLISTAFAVYRASNGEVRLAKGGRPAVAEVLGTEPTSLRFSSSFNRFEPSVLQRTRLLVEPAGEEPYEANAYHQESQVYRPGSVVDVLVHPRNRARVHIVSTVDGREP